MINRELIRLKVVQLSYAYYQNGSNKLDSAEKELFFSMSKAYDLYLYMLELMVEVNRIAERTVETAKSREARLREGLSPSTRFIDNRFIQQLQLNHQLKDFRENQKKTWSDEEDFVRRMYKRVVESEAYKDWMARTDEPSYDDERQLWRDIYRTVFVDCEDLDQLLEEKSLYWNDDRFIIDGFVLKTIKRFELRNGTNQPLLPEYRDDEDREFAKRLFRATLLGAEHYKSLISQFLRNWELERVAFMDLVVLQTALAEIFTFPQIPVSVSINEYVEIAKMYGTPRSGAYVNGMLDSICRRQIEEGRLRKQMTVTKGDAEEADPEDEL